MKHIIYLLSAFALLIVLSFLLMPTAHAQSGPPVATAGATDAAMNALLDQAQKAIDTASATNAQASAAISQAGIVLNFIQVVAIIGGAAATLVSIGLGASGLRTLGEYRKDLDEAQAELGGMKQQLLDATQQATTAQAGLEATSQIQIEALRHQAATTLRAMSMLQMGQQQFETGNMRAARQMYEEAVRLNPDNPVTNYLLGEVYLIERNLEPAVDHLEKALALDSNLAPAYAALGLVQRLQAEKENDPDQRNQRFAEAETNLLKAIGIEPSTRDVNKESVYSTLGGLYRRQGRLDDAIGYYSKAEKITPNNSYPVVNLALLHFMRGDVEKANGYFERTIAASLKNLAINPADTWARGDVITARLALGQTDEAFRELEALTSQARSVGSMETLLSGWRNLKGAPHPPADIDKAIEVLHAAIEKTHLKATDPI